MNLPNLRFRRKRSHNDLSVDRLFVKFSKVAEALTRQGKDERSVWLALGHFHRFYATEETKKEAIAILSNPVLLKDFIKDIEEGERSEKLNRLNTGIEEIKKQNEEVKEQNNDLKEDNKRLKEEVTILLRQNDLLVKQGRNATYLALGLFALSVVVSLTPIVAKRMGYDLEKSQNPVPTSQQDNFVADRPRIPGIKKEPKLPKGRKTAAGQKLAP